MKTNKHVSVQYIDFQQNCDLPLQPQAAIFKTAMRELLLDSKVSFRPVFRVIFALLNV